MKAVYYSNRKLILSEILKQNPALNLMYQDEYGFNPFDGYDFNEISYKYSNNLKSNPTPLNSKTINRIGGVYEPTFKSLNIFKQSKFDKLYKFTTSDKIFDNNTKNYDSGTISTVISKVNRFGEILKLRNGNAKYPMVDEYGYDIVKVNVFKTSWERNFYREYNKIIEK